MDQKCRMCRQMTYKARFYEAKTKISLKPFCFSLIFDLVYVCCVVLSTFVCVGRTRPVGLTETEIFNAQNLDL